jgi:topoisomerase-4 subunit B
MQDLFSKKPPKIDTTYDASAIEILEGLEPVRRRPGMYIGGTDEKSLHHLVNEVLDNAMDEVVAGHATTIKLELSADNNVTISDNGRGIPIDSHPKFPDKSALEVILTTLHSGGKFDSKVYATAGGLHGVGLSVVNALSNFLEVKVIRDNKLYTQTYCRGTAQTKLIEAGEVASKNGTTITFHPDPEIFGEIVFDAKTLYELAKSKAYLFKGVEIKWKCDPSLVTSDSSVLRKASIKFPAGLKDYLAEKLPAEDMIISEYFSGETESSGTDSKLEWAIAWSFSNSFAYSFCNTIPTPLGGTHEAGFKNAILKGLKQYGEITGNKKANQLTSEDVQNNSCSILSVFIHEPHFQGQTKEKLVSTEVTRLVESAIKDRFDHWLSNNRKIGDAILQFVIEQMEERLNRKNLKETNRKSVTQRLRLPGKLTDCVRTIPQGTEIFLVEGDSAGGSAKQARNRETQAILPLRGKILNVANNSSDKINLNKELSDLELALGCGSLKNYKEENLRYEKVIIMTDADIDGAHIASLLMTYFFKSMPDLVKNGHLYLARPPLYRIVHSNKTYYAQNDSSKEQLLKKLAKNRGHIEVSRFKGLGEMTAAQLKETTMDPKIRILDKVIFDNSIEDISQHVENLMGRKAESRLKFIQEQTVSYGSKIADNLDI